MSSICAWLHRPAIRLMGMQLEAADTPEKMRIVFDRWRRILIPSPGVSIERDSLGGVPAIHMTPKRDATVGALLMLHGGGYVFGSAHDYRYLVARLAKWAGLNGYVLDYRLAPEHPYPAALDDALTAYRALLEMYPPEKIGVAGDSAGGGLVVSMMLRLRDFGLALPSCGVLFCPWLDLTGSGDSMKANAATELLIKPQTLSRMAGWYAPANDLTHPELSPLFGRHDGLPPLLVQASSSEVLRSDAERFAKRARSAGVEVTLDMYREMWHDWQLMAPLVREARQALFTAAEFLAAYTDRQGPLRNSS